MNERIRELAEQAGFTEGGYESDEGPWIGPEFNKEKFAELIVRECLSICDKETAEYVKFRQGTSDFDEKNIYAEGEVAAMGIKYKIKHLFGVEK